MGREEEGESVVGMQIVLSNNKIKQNPALTKKPKPKPRSYRNKGQNSDCRS